MICPKTKVGTRVEMISYPKSGPKEVSKREIVPLPIPVRGTVTRIGGILDSLMFWDNPPKVEVKLDKRYDLGDGEVMNHVVFNVKHFRKL